MAGRRPARRRRHRLQRFSDGAGRYHDPRHRLPVDQSPGRRPLRLSRSQDTAKMSAEALETGFAPERDTGVFARLARDRVAALAGLVLTVVVLAALLAPWIAPYDPYFTDLTKVMRPPDAEHWFGTDNTGR